ncbi:MAG: hypothetical protein KKE02_24520 [Alphaproteobacteria bacterium]|nr:hypothetical protein [Alphaproteobacteria bacterium]MBU1516461.1 hypothetical protein [Alphaproteobacteria bacterium]MBU2094218.1 hypothetical protein [Alphaproteobacteria bacterium]MBU2154205.1 hypothetical protein [Alphaproteobacteria bacterium]MBU2307388.1 hypothetical protein [Alphaproteobacteria bacterium]
MLKFGTNWLRTGALIAVALLAPMSAMAAGGEKPVARTYPVFPAAKLGMTDAEADKDSAGCITCHTDSDAKTMHVSQAVKLGCASCHGGDASVMAPAGLAKTAAQYTSLRERAHVLPKYPETWHYPSSANPKQSYTLLNKESPEFIRFINPSDYRVARQACGACHMELIEKAERSLMATGAMFYGGASYNNGILPFKNYLLGEAYTAHGEPARLLSPGSPHGTVTPEQAKRGALPTLYPAPTWQVTPPGDIFRVFERGGRNINTQFAEVGLPNANGALQRLEEPGRPDIRQSNRGPGTGLRAAIPLLNIHKTRLNDPFTWFLGTNDQPGDYRSSGCASCHVVYANNRQPHASSTWAQYGRDGQSAQVDPTISKEESGHPIKHAFTRSIPTAQCMNCHMHQPNMFVNTYLGYTMWDYESDAPFMWPERQKYPTTEEIRKVLDRNPEGAAPRGKWADLDFLRNVFGLNTKLKDTQFADYHGHGWNFRAIFKRNRDGELLDKDGAVIANDDPEKFHKAGAPEFTPVGQNAPGKAVHMMDIHAEKGMQCADCHFSQDSHGSGLIMGEVANAVEIRCKDCHGSSSAYPTLRTSGPAADPKGNDLTLLRNPDGQRRFEWMERDGRQVLIQRSLVDPKLEWRVKLTKDTVDRTSPDYNAKSARAKLMSKISQDGKPFQWGPGVAPGARAHNDDEMECFACHTSWTTACAGCHLPIEANWKTTSHKYEGEETRNYATYNPQVARDDMYQLGVHMTSKGSTIAPIRSSSALVLSSTNVNRERIYVQQPPISASGFSSQAFAPHFPHTVRTTETKTCSDCHVSAANDNNAIMSQLLLLGTNFVNFVGLNTWVGLEGGIEAVRVSEYSEPQAVFGSYLQKYAYPDFYKLHVEQNKRELKNWVRGKPFVKGVSGGEEDSAEEISNFHAKTDGAARCLQLRGEYMFVAEGTGGFHVLDAASVANKGISQRVISAPFSPLGNNTRVPSKNATCMALPTNQNIAPLRNEAMKTMMVKDLAGGPDLSLLQANQEQAFHPLYSYAVVTDSEEGLILVNVNTLADGDPRNNNLKRAVTWNAGNVLKGARHITLGGHYAYIAADAGLVVVDLNDPLKPRYVTTVALPDVRGSALQFRYLWVTTARGLEVLDVTKLDQPRLIEGATVPLVDARRVYVARTFAYVAAKKDGLVIVDVKNPERPRLYQKFNAGGALNDAEDVVVASTNASLFAYVADGKNGMKVLQLISPSSQPNFYGFSPPPKPELIAWAKTPTPALALSKGLDRDRAVDETGGQMAIFGRLGSRPFTRPEMERFFTDQWGRPYRVSDEVDMTGWLGPRATGQAGR